MTTEIAFTVDGKPRGKGRPRMSLTGRPFTPKATVAAELTIAKLAAVASAGRPLMTGTVNLHIEAIFEVPKSWSAKDREAALSGAMEYTGKPDRDNIEKLVMDALNGVVWLDDAQVNRGPVIRRYGLATRTEVRVEELIAEGRKSPAERRREAKLEKGGVIRKARKKPLKRLSSACEVLAIGRRVRRDPT